MGRGEGGGSMGEGLEHYHHVGSLFCTIYFKCGSL